VSKIPFFYVILFKNTKEGFAMTIKIYFDLDDVGNELCRYLFETYNKEHSDDFHWLNSDTFMLAENEGLKADNDYFKEVLHRKGTFLNLSAAPSYVAVMKKLIHEGYDVRILTHPQDQTKFF